MSSTVTTATMVAELARRVPLGFSANVAMDSINGALRWINQQGSFPWLLRKTTVQPIVSPTSGYGTFSMPTDFDAGKEAVLYGIETDAVPTEIPFKPWGQAVKHQVHQSAGTGTGIVSCWSFFAAIGAGPSYTVTMTGSVFPTIAAKAAAPLQFVYHSVKYPDLTSGAYYLPTPDHFDYFVIELAEAEMMRQYRIAGWDILYKRVTDQLRAMLQAYTTTKIAMSPSPEVVNAANTTQALRAS